MIILMEKGRYNLETCLMCPDYVKAFDSDYVKAFDSVIRDKLFEILQSKNISYLLLKTVIEFHAGSKI